MSCLNLYHDTTVQCVCNHGIRFPGRFSDYLNSDSVRVSSQVLIICHDNTIIPKCLCKHSHNLKFHVSSNKTQVMYTTTQTWEIPQSSQSKKTTSTFLRDVSLRSASNSEFWMPSRTLLSLSSLRDIWQQDELQTKTKIYRQNHIYCVTRCVSPPFKLKSDACAQPMPSFLKTTSEPRADKINYSLVVKPGEFQCLWHSAQG